ncbi:unnamed protein product, partial [Amoebophrya sp. A120]
ELLQQRYDDLHHEQQTTRELVEVSAPGLGEADGVDDLVAYHDKKVHRKFLCRKSDKGTATSKPFIDSSSTSSRGGRPGVVVHPQLGKKTAPAGGSSNAFSPPETTNPPLKLQDNEPALAPAVFDSLVASFLPPRDK